MAEMQMKSDEVLAAELTVAMLNHNAQIHSSQGRSMDSVINEKVVGSNYAYLLNVIQGTTDPFASPKKENK